MNKPIVGITMGDPAGSGPEITIKALADPEQYTYCRPIVVGDVKVFEQARKFVGREDIVIHRCDKVSDALFTPGTIDVLHLDLIEDINKFEMAKVSVEGGNAAFQCVKKVIELAMAGEVDATCTNALNKEAMNLARIGNKYLADTEPWKLAKTDMPRVATILNISLQLVANLAIAFEPFLPFSSEKLRKMLNRPAARRTPTGNPRTVIRED